MLESTNNKKPFMSVLADIETFHGINIDENLFIEIAMRGWEAIGNRRVEICATTLELDKGFSKLPCGLYRLLAVTMDWERCLYNYDNYLNVNIKANPFYSPKANLSNKFGKKSQLEVGGEYIHYHLSDEGIHVDPSLDKIHILYSSLDTDEEGLPYLTSKEAFALAAYVTYVYKYRQLLTGTLKDPSIIQFLKVEYERLMRDARVPDTLNQNLLDSALNIKNSFERKKYNRSYWLFKDV